MHARTQGANSQSLFSRKPDENMQNVWSQMSKDCKLPSVSRSCQIDDVQVIHTAQKQVDGIQKPAGTTII